MAGRPHWHPKTCKVCGAAATTDDPISQTGKCGPCGDAALVDNIGQMLARSGPNFTRWRRAMAGCAGGILMDDLNEALDREQSRAA